jgi:hypothetical protein
MTEKKVAKKRVTKKTARPKKVKSIFERMEDTVLGQPIRIVNRTFLASLGVVATVQNEFEKFQTDFEKTFDRLVKDGEKARDRYRREFRGFRKDVREFGEDVREYGEDMVEDIVEDVVEAKDKVVENLKSAA